MNAFIPSGHSPTGCYGAHRLPRAPKGLLSGLSPVPRLNATPARKMGFPTVCAHRHTGCHGVEPVLLFEEIGGYRSVIVEAVRSLPFKEVPVVGVHVKSKAISVS